jgi:hypothetical protein
MRRGDGAVAGTGKRKGALLMNQKGSLFLGWNFIPPFSRV